MKSYITLPKDSKQNFLDNASVEWGMQNFLIEKDFWVCWILERLFKLPEFSKHFTFKGGTSLSKVYSAIPRFSEDIDLAIHRDFVSKGELEDIADRSKSKSKRERLKKDFDQKCETLIKEKLYPALNESIKNELSGMDCAGMLDFNSTHKHSLIFAYEPVQKIDSYVRQHVLIELGWLSDHHPEENKIVCPYVANLFENKDEFSIIVRVLDWRRTFWEKTTALHRIAMFKENKPIPKNICRHYYDIFKLLKNKPLQYWNENSSILKDVLEFNDLCAEENHFKYNDILTEGLKIIPRDNIIEELRNDYEDTLIMIYESPKPSFAEIMKKLEKFQNNYNKSLGEGSR